PAPECGRASSACRSRAAVQQSSCSMSCPPSLTISAWPLAKGFRHAIIDRTFPVPTMRQITLVGFLQAQNCTNIASSWRHPRSRSDSWSPDYYRHIGRVLEAGKFHLGFFDDRLSMPDMDGQYHDDHRQHDTPCVQHA